jgi:predicted nucleic acid-binding protein
VTHLLDTNVLSELRKDRRAHPNVWTWAESVDRSVLRTSVLVIAELQRGAELARRRDAAQARNLEAYVAIIRTDFAGRILPIDHLVADRWARLGVPDPLPAIDGLIAATALVHGLTLVTRNERDIARTGVRVLNPWLAPA